MKEDILIRSFGRVRGRKLSNHKQFLFDELLQQYQIKEKPLQENNNILEIGFGFGDFLFDKAKNNQDKNFFGFEPHVNGAVNLLGQLEKEPLNNVKIATSDVREFLSEVDDEIFNQVYILFPDPWPKFKHFKRRLITKNFLDEILAPKIKKNGQITIATDHDSYKIWILSEITKSEKFSWIAENKTNWQNFPDDWLKTKYQLKAEIEGRVSVIFNLVKKC